LSDDDKIKLSRRWFVFGSVAAVAAATIPQPVVALLEPPVVRLPSAHVFLRRAIRDFTFSFVDVPPGEAAEPAFVSLFVHRGGKRSEQPVFGPIGIRACATFRWVACGPLDQLIVLPDDTFELVVDARHLHLVGKLFMVADDTVDEGPPITVVETHDWPNTGPTPPMFVHVDNSLEARLARQSNIPLPDFDDDYDYGDDDDDGKYDSNGYDV
jgi:hypothetical protein